MECNIKNRNDLINDYTSGALSNEEMETFDEHCFNCETCFQELLLKKRIICIIKNESKAIFADYLTKPQISYFSKLRSVINNIKWEQSNSWIYGIVTTGAVAILCFFIYRSFSPQTYISENETSNPIVQHDDTSESKQLIVLSPKDTTIETVIEEPDREQTPNEDILIDKETEEEFADNFDPSPYLDEMLTNISRSSNILVISPNNDENFNSDIIFKWEELGGVNIYLKILNNKGEEFFNISTDKNQFHYSQILKPGLYYWKLENEDDLLYLGKFYYLKHKK